MTSTETTLPDASPASLQADLDALRSTFSLDTVRPAAVRAGQLRRLADEIGRSRDEIARAVSDDFGHRAELETLTAETGFTARMLRHTARHLGRWTRDRVRPAVMSGVPGVARLWTEPKGVAGVIAPWNYPFHLAVLPAATALAAGCKVMLKPSEFSPRTAAVIASVMGRVWDEDDLRIRQGGTETARAFSGLAFDHLFFTGSTATGREIAKAAAANLTPVTLELGGKSPCLMMPDAEPSTHAPLAGWGKWFSAGQTCVAPDYLLVPQGTGRAWADALLDVAHRFLAEAGDYSAIASDRHHQRLGDMVAEAEAAGATVLRAEPPARAGNETIMAPAVVLGAPDDCRLMEEEVFGPVLPIREYGELPDAVAWINARQAPLAAYVFGRDAAQARRTLRRVRSGGGAVNATVLHLGIPDMPFGGIGASGMGAYRGRDGILTFSHRRTVLGVPDLKLLKETLLPPYEARQRQAIRWTSR
jgi:coniferyl-aldehyde dehydrogenase